MQTVSTALRNAIDQGLSLKAKPLVIAEWNLNRHAGVTTVANLGTDPGTDEDLFPISSIAEGLRPTRGIVRARVGNAWTNTAPDMPRFRISGPNTQYKYWASDGVSANTQVGGVYAVTQVKPYILYSTTAACNKIVLRFENSAGTIRFRSGVVSTSPNPNSVDIYITTNGGSTWVNVGTGLSADLATGEINLYLQNNGTWTNTVNRANFTNINGIRVDVNGMSMPRAFVNIIEFSARLERDITADTMNFSINKQMTEESRTLPVGRINSNTASITIDNTTQTYNNNNNTSIYYNMIESNVKFTLSLGIDTTAFGGTGYEYIQQGVYYADAWNGQDTATVTIDTTDFTKFMQTQDVIPFLFIDKPTWRIVEYLINSMGFNNHFIHTSTTESDYVIPFCWFKDGTVWDALQELCESTQSIIFFDELEQLHFMSRDYLFDTSTVTPARQLDAVKNGSKQADLADISNQYSVSVNRVKINYNTYSRHTDGFGHIVGAVLWQPQETIALRSSLLERPMDNTQTNLYIDPKIARLFPKTGDRQYLNIEGEILSFDTFQYRYWTSHSNSTTVAVKTLDDQRKYDKLSPDGIRDNNAYTGRLSGVIRGEKGTRAHAHNIDINSWTTYWTKTQAGAATQINGISRNPDSILRMHGRGRTNYHFNFYTALRGSTSDFYRAYGTELLFHTGTSHASGGICINMQSNNKTGYFVELVASGNADKQHIFEVRCYRRNSDGSLTFFGNTNGIARPTIPKAVWHSLDVTCSLQAGNPTFNVYVNGNYMGTFADSTAGKITTGKWGTFIRGNSMVDFEYFYAAENVSINDPQQQYSPDQSGFIDKIEGGYVSGYVDKEAFYNWRYNKKAKKQQKDYIAVFDDFGPWVHEVRKLEVQFDDDVVPALSAGLHMTTSDIDVPEFSYTSFNSTFWIANRIRTSHHGGVAVLNGDYTFRGVTNNYQATVIGQNVTKSDDKTLTVKDDNGIRRDGLNELEVTSRFIQSPGAAKNLGNWITQHWATGLETVDATVFIHPAQQLVDTVTVNYPRLNMTPANNVYAVVGITIGWDNGIVGNLTLRRIL